MKKIERRPFEEVEKEFLGACSRKSKTALLKYYDYVKDKDLYAIATRDLPGYQPDDSKVEVPPDTNKEVLNIIKSTIDWGLEELRMITNYYHGDVKKAKDFVRKNRKMRRRGKILRKKDIEWVQKIGTALFCRYMPVVRYFTDQPIYYSIFIARVALLIAGYTVGYEGVCVLWQDCETAILESIKTDIKENFNGKIEIDEKYSYWQDKEKRAADVRKLLESLQGRFKDMEDMIKAQQQEERK